MISTNLASSFLRTTRTAVQPNGGWQLGRGVVVQFSLPKRYFSRDHKTAQEEPSSSLSRLWQVATIGAVGVTCFLGSRYLSSSSWRYDDEEEDELFDSKAPVDPQAEITSKAYIDVDIDRQPAGRIVVGLHGNVVPRTVRNFEHLCRGHQKIGYLKLSYVGSPFHRIIPNLMIQGGDFTAGNGTGGWSIYGDMFRSTFGDENFTLRHVGPGVVSMANYGPHSNGSQFLITTKRTPHLDGKHVVFGVVTDGWDVVKAIEACGSSSGKPSRKVVISAAGLLPSDSQDDDDDNKNDKNKRK